LRCFYSRLYVLISAPVRAPPLGRVWGSGRPSTVRWGWVRVQSGSDNEALCGPCRSPAAWPACGRVRAGSDGWMQSGPGFRAWACRGARPPVGIGLRCMVRLCGASPSGRPLGQPKTGTGDGGFGVTGSGVGSGSANFARHRAFAARMAVMARSRSMASAIPSRSGFIASDHSVR
jgi:hypothetical protein